MKIIDAITRIDNLKHNTYTKGEKIAWLSRVDGSIKRLVIDTHEGGGGEFQGYTEEADDVELLVPAPWDELYIHWLEAQIDYQNGEYTKYNNSAARYNEVLQEFSSHYTREHKPLVVRPGFF